MVVSRFFPKKSVCLCIPFGKWSLFLYLFETETTSHISVSLKQVWICSGYGLFVKMPERDLEHNGHMFAKKDEDMVMLTGMYEMGYVVPENWEICKSRKLYFFPCWFWKLFVMVNYVSLRLFVLITYLFYLNFWEQIYLLYLFFQIRKGCCA